MKIQKHKRIKFLFLIVYIMDEEHCRIGEYFKKSFSSQKSAPPDFIYLINVWFDICLCQPGFECYEIYSNDESMLFFALFLIVNNWWKKLKAAVNLDVMKINLIVIYDDISDSRYYLILKKTRRLRTIRNKNNDNV